MTVNVANTELNNSFNTWRLNTNYIATIISNNVVTVSGTGDTARGGVSHGTGHIEGTFSSTTLKTGDLRGGNTTNDGPITIASNTTISGEELVVNSDSTFNSNVDFNVTGSDRLIMPDVSRIRLPGGQNSQFLQIMGDHEKPRLKYLTMRDMTDLKLDHADFVLAGGNTDATADTNSPHLIISGGNANTDAVHIYLAGAPLAGDSDLYIKLVDTGGDSALVLTDSSNTIVATIDSSGGADFKGTLNVDGSSTLNGLTATTVTANGAVDFNSTLNVDGNTTVNGLTATTVTANGAVDFNSTLNVDGSSTLNGLTATTVTANGSVDFNSTLNVDGSSTLNGLTATTISANGAVDFDSSLNVDGSTTVNDLTATTISANGAVDFDSTLNVDGDTTVNSLTTTSLTANGAVDFNSTLNVDGSSTLNGLTATTISANGTSSLNDLTVTTLSANGTSTLQGTTVTTLSASDASSLHGLTATTISANGAVDFDSSLNVDGSTTVNDLTATTISANGAVDFDSTLNVDGSSTLNGLTTTTLTANGAVDFNSTLNVDGSSTLNELTATTLTANSSVNFNTGSVFANGNITIGTDRTAVASDADKNAMWVNGGLSKLTVFANTVFKDKVTIPGGVTSESSGAFGGLTVTGATLLNGNVTLGDADTDTITVSGDFTGAIKHTTRQLFNNSAVLNLATITNGTIASTKLQDNLTSEVGTYGTSSVIPTITVNSKGLITAISNTSIAGLSSFTYTAANTTLRITSTDSTEFDVDLPATTTAASSGAGDDVLGLASFDSGKFTATDGWVQLSDSSTGAVLGVKGTSNEVDVSRSNGTVTVGLPDDVTIAGQLTVSENVVISGNLVVSGTTTEVNTTQLNIGDNIIKLNTDLADDTAPSENAGIEIERGSAANAKIRWNETSDRWQLSSNNVNFYDILSNNVESITNRAETSTVNSENDFLLLYDADDANYLKKVSVANIAAAGDKGASGIKGEKGASGIKGAKGATGLKGIKGATGLKGIKGATGQKGASGLKGDKGATGLKGIKGATGLKGIKGATGLKGIKGATGLKGIKGATGQKGAPGVLDLPSDPNDDRIVFWDDSASGHKYLDIAGGLSISGTTLTGDAVDSASFNTSNGILTLDMIIGTTGSNTDITVDLDGRYAYPVPVNNSGGNLQFTVGESTTDGLRFAATTGAVVSFDSGTNKVTYGLADNQLFGSSSTVQVGNQHENIEFNNSGHIDVKVNNSHTARFESDGDLHVKSDIVAYSATISDERLKENIEVVDNALNKVSQLNGVTFNWKEDGKASAGLIAQDVESVLPSAVKERELPFKGEDDQEYKTVEYSQVTSLIVEAIKELKAENEELRAIIEEMKG